MNSLPWRAFNRETFADAQSQNKPILLSIVAPWSQACRAMDEETYSNEAYAQYIVDNFVPVRVNSDRQPHIANRYTAGSWPTTSVLTPEGDVIWAGGFVPVADMGNLLPQILHAYQNDKQGLAQRVGEQREQIRQQTAMPPLNRTLVPTFEVSQIVLLGIKQNYDFAFGGFGREQKTIHADALEFCFALISRLPQDHPETGDLLLMSLRTMANMANGRMHDQFAGGFFRYTERPDWQQPRFEKLLDENANILRTFARAYQLLTGGTFTGDVEGLRLVGEKSVNWITETLWDDEKGIWYGSQVADDEYFSQPDDERADWNPPAADETIPCGANALAIRAHVSWWATTGDADALLRAKRAGEFLMANLRREDEETGSVTYNHTDEDDAEPLVLLADLADVCAAFLDLYEAGQGNDFLDEAEAVANFAASNLEDLVSGGLYDHVTENDAPGTLNIGTKDLADNMQMSDALLRLYLATGEEAHAHLSTRILQAFLPAVGQIGFFATPVALVAERAMTLPAIVHVLGKADDPQTIALIRAAHKPYRYARMIQPLDPSVPEDAEHIQNLEYALPPTGMAVAYVAVGETVQEPTSDPAKLSELVATATGTITLPEGVGAPTTDDAESVA